MTTSNGLLRLGPDREPVPLEIAASYRARTRGLLGRDGIPGAALLLTPAGSVHTFRMRFAIDVAYLDRRLRVIALTTMPPAARAPRLRSRHVLEAEAGAMTAWGLRVGSQLHVEGPDGPDPSQLPLGPARPRR